jgi:alkanesulfonate monooxygenase SsuD/methylene tetrahydromethanopterin reductase-like flavin-dependent oxidoreductase (luciferase family)
MTGQLHLAVALDGYGWHPQAWRATLAADPPERPDSPSVLSGRYWAELARTAERGLLDFLTIDDTLMPQPGRRERIDARRLAGRADAVLIAARIAPATRHIGLIPVATVTHTEPFHISKAIATLDYVSHGRAGWQPRVSVTTHEAALFGRRDGSQIPLFEEAVDYVDVVRRLWDSWEDDAVIRDVATGRYVDTDKLHYIDFTGKYFSVKGPSITPRPPQGQPVVAGLAHAGPVYEFAAASADVVFITPTDSPSYETAVRTILDEVRAADGGRLKVFADVVVSLDGDGDFKSDALVFAGSATELADMLLDWQRLGIDGARLRPAVNATDLPTIVDEVVPILQRAGRFRAGYRDGETLRERLGLPVAPNRYTAVHQ